MTPTAELLSQLLLTSEQVAELLGVSPTCVRGLHETGQLRGICVGKELHWRPQWVQDYVDKLEPKSG